MKKFSELIETRGDTAVFTFGRFNPPTTGHEKLIDALAKEQKKNPGSPMYVFPSHSQDPKKNPLPHALKVAFMKKMFRKYAKNITVNKARNIFEVASFLHNKGHRAIIMVVGSDRVDEFDRLLNQYNGQEGRHGYYGFDNIEVVSAGERDPDAEGVEGMSASKMRVAASDGDYDSFQQGLPRGFNEGEKLYRDVRKNMGIREHRSMGMMDEYEEMRDAYLTGQIWNVGDIVEVKGMSGEIVRKGTNYISFMSEDGKVHKAWLSDIMEKLTVGSDFVRDEIIKSAKEHGIDPKIALRVWKAEGRMHYQSRITRADLDKKGYKKTKTVGGREASYGPYQLYTGKGLGAEYEKKYGVKLIDDNNPAGIKRQIQFAMGRAKKGGWKPWYGAAKAGIKRYEGIRKDELIPQEGRDKLKKALETDTQVAKSPAPEKKEKQTFGQAFAAARKKQGAGGTFTWKGKQFTTRSDDDPKDKPKPEKPTAIAKVDKPKPTPKVEPKQPTAIAKVDKPVGGADLSAPLIKKAIAMAQVDKPKKKYKAIINPLEMKPGDDKIKPKKPTVDKAKQVASWDKEFEAGKKAAKLKLAASYDPELNEQTPTKWKDDGSPVVRPTRPGYKTPKQREKVFEPAAAGNGNIKTKYGTIGPRLKTAGTKRHRLNPDFTLGPGKDISGERTGGYEYKYKMNPASRKNVSDISAPAQRTKEGERIIGYGPSAGRHPTEKGVGKAIERKLGDLRIKDWRGIATGPSPITGKRQKTTQDYKQRQKQVAQRKKIQLSNQKQRDMQTKLQTKQREFQRKATQEKLDTQKEEVWDKPMPEKEKKGKLTPAQKAKAKARAAKAGRPYPNMIDNMWASNEEFKLDEVWTKDIAAKISQVTHPRGWKEMVLQFVKGMKDPEHKKHPSAFAAEIAAPVKGVDGRQLIKYINKLIDKGVLPQDLKASYHHESFTFKDLVNKINERPLTNTEKKTKEHNVKKLKKHLGSFEDTYGEGGKSVMYAVATRDAKKEKKYKT